MNRMNVAREQQHNQTSRVQADSRLRKTQMIQLPGCQLHSAPLSSERHLRQSTKEQSPGNPLPQPCSLARAPTCAGTSKPGDLMESKCLERGEHPRNHAIAAVMIEWSKKHPVRLPPEIRHLQSPKLGRVASLTVGPRAASAAQPGRGHKGPAWPGNGRLTRMA